MDFEFLFAILVFLLDGPELLSLWVGPAIGIPAGRLLRILALAHLPVIANGPGVQIALGKGLLRPAAAFSVPRASVALPAASWKWRCRDLRLSVVAGPNRLLSLRRADSLTTACPTGT